MHSPRRPAPPVMRCSPSHRIVRNAVPLPAHRFARLVASFALSTLVFALLAAAEKPAAREQTLLVTVDGDTQTITVKAKRYRAATVAGENRWLSDARDVDVPITEGHHLVEIRTKDAAPELVGLVQMPSVD